ncbi:14269_t:CDS:2, partial [Acaulospora colombiana]
PEYEKAANVLKAENIKIASVDCTTEAALCSENDIKGYPTLKVFKEGNASDYNGGRKADLIISYMKKQALPAVSDVTVETLDAFKDSDNIVIIGFWNSKSQNEHDTFNIVAEKLRNDYLFGQTAQDEAAAKAEVTAPAVVLYKKFDELKDVLEGTFDEEKLVEFIKTNSIPLLDEIGPENYASYIDSGLPLAFLFYENDEQRATYGKIIEPVAKEYKGQINFVYINASKFGGHADNINLKKQWPAFGIQKPEEGLKYPFDQTKEITTEGIAEFLSKFVNDEIEPSIKSEPIPEKNDGPVSIVVAHTFEEIIYDKAKDVLVEFYAPWCGHCKKLSPIWDQLGETYSKAKDKIVIAKMNCNDNDIPSNATFKVSGFPTIKLFKAGDKEIVDYKGDRTLESFIEFIGENAVNKVDIESDTPKETSSSPSSAAPTTTTAGDSKHEEL